MSSERFCKLLMLVGLIMAGLPILTGEYLYEVKVVTITSGLGLVGAAIFLFWLLQHVSSEWGSLAAQMTVEIPILLSMCAMIAHVEGVITLPFDTLFLVVLPSFWILVGVVSAVMLALHIDLDWFLPDAGPHIGNGKRKQYPPDFPYPQ